MHRLRTARSRWTGRRLRRRGRRRRGSSEATGGLKTVDGEDLKRAVRDVWARYPETSAVTLQAYLVDLADECEGWAR